MPIDLLRKIEHADFPLTITDSRDVADVEILTAACLLIAAFSRSSSESSLAVVVRITPEGQALLERHR